MLVKREYLLINIFAPESRMFLCGVQSVVAGMVINPIRGKYPQIMFHEIMSSKISTHLQEVVLEVIA